MLKASKQILDDILLIGRAYVNPTKAQQMAALVELGGFLNVEKSMNLKTLVCTLNVSENAIEYMRKQR